MLYMLHVMHIEIFVFTNNLTFPLLVAAHSSAPRFSSLRSTVSAQLVAVILWATF